MIRINKYLSQCGVTSRRGAEALIKEGRVAVNGRPLTEVGAVIEEATDEVRVDGEVVFHRDRRPGRGLAPTAGEIETAAGRLRERIAKNVRREPLPPLEGRP